MGRYGLHVMRAGSTRGPPGPHSPRPTYSLPATLAGTAVLALALLGAMVAVAYPVATVLTAAFALAARSAVRSHRRRSTTRTVCVPKTGVCVEA